MSIKAKNNLWSCWSSTRVHLVEHLHGVISGCHFKEVMDWIYETIIYEDALGLEVNANVILRENFVSNVHTARALLSGSWNYLYIQKQTLEKQVIQ